MISEGFICRFCFQLKHSEESCEWLNHNVMCDCCRQTFDPSDLCWDCYMLPYPLRLCAECLAIEEEYVTQHA